MSGIFMPGRMSQALGSTLPLTLLLAIGLVFFLRAASKDRTTVVEIRSSRPPLEVLPALTEWLLGRGWVAEETNPERRLLRFRGQVEASGSLALLLSLLGAVGAACLGLVLCQLLPALAWWPLLLTALGPLAGWIYRRRAARPETLELRLISHDEATGSALQMRAHRDELIALEQEMGPRLGLFGAGDLLHSPI
ncbi:MAG: hypothetical protein RLZZ32_1713 [Cyanobacteriota bacterium]|jgi:hypothetical protein